MFGKRKPKKPDHLWSAMQLHEARMEIDKVLAGIDAGTIDKEEYDFRLSWAFSCIAKAWHFWDMSDAEFEALDGDAVGWHMYSIPNFSFQFTLVHPEATFETRDKFPPQD